MKKDNSSYPLLAILKGNGNLREVNDTTFKWLESFPTKKNPMGTRIVSNNLQILKTYFSNKKDKEKYLIKHYKDIEKVLWYGNNKGTTGVLSFLDKDKRTIKLKKNFSEKKFNKFMGERFKHGLIYSHIVKYLFVDINSFNYLVKLVPTQKINSKINTFGIKDIVIYYYFTPTAGVEKIYIIKEPILVNTMCLIDIDTYNLMFCYVKGKKFSLRKHRRKDRMIYYYLTKYGLELSRSRHHLIAKLI